MSVLSSVSRASYYGEHMVATLVTVLAHTNLNKTKARVNFFAIGFFGIVITDPYSSVFGLFDFVYCKLNCFWPIHILILIVYHTTPYCVFNGASHAIAPVQHRSDDSVASNRTMRKRSFHCPVTE